jgi:hypothetical protein
MLVSIFLLILLCCSIANAKEVDYWQQLNRAANEHFAGIDVDIKFEIGTVEKNAFDDSETDQYGKLIFSVPLLSKNSRIKRNSEKLQFLKNGADLICEIEKSEKLIEQRKKYLFALKKMDDEGGLEILNKIMTIQTEMIDFETKRDAAKRKLEGYLKCSEK